MADSLPEAQFRAARAGVPVALMALGHSDVICFAKYVFAARGYVDALYEAERYDQARVAIDETVATVAPYMRDLAAPLAHIYVMPSLASH